MIDETKKKMEFTVAPIIGIPIIIVILIPFYFVNRITLNELYMRFVKYDEVHCEFENRYSQYRRSKDYVFYFTYNYKGKSYEGSDRIDSYNNVSKNIIKGNTSNVVLYVSPIFPSYSILKKPDWDSLYDWFGMALMSFLSIFSFIFVISAIKFTDWKIK